MERSEVQNFYKEEELSQYQKDVLQWKGDGFDNRVHILDHKTGKLLRIQPYRYVVNSEGSYYVREGKMFTEKGNLLNGPKALDEAKPQNEHKKLTK